MRSIAIEGIMSLQMVQQGSDRCCFSRRLNEYEARYILSLIERGDPALCLRRAEFPEYRTEINQSGGPDSLVACFHIGIRRIDGNIPQDEELRYLYGAFFWNNSLTHIPDYISDRILLHYYEIISALQDAGIEFMPRGDDQEFVYWLLPDNRFDPNYRMSVARD